jgi:hypothetical protein
MQERLKADGMTLDRNYLGALLNSVLSELLSPTH